MLTFFPIYIAQTNTFVHLRQCIFFYFYRKMTTYFGLKNQKCSRWPPFNMDNISKTFVQQDN